MSRISIRTQGRADVVDRVAGIGGTAVTTTYFADDGTSLQLHAHALDAGGRLDLLPADTDRIGYVRTGSVEAAGHRLAAGSSFIVERDAALSVASPAGPAAILLFAGPAVSGGGQEGQVLLLPADRVPSFDGGSTSAGGAMHADAVAAGNGLWLHESRMPGRSDTPPRDGMAGIHAHTEDEIIVVTAGEMRLGGRLVGPGTAIRIAADTLYGFTPGPAGLSFVNFRAGRPGAIRFADGNSLDEVGYWRDRLPPPRYIRP